MNSKLSNENLLEINDHNEILTLIDLLVLRVECLTNETKSKQKKKIKENYPTVAEVDQNLIEYLYYLFTKFTHDDPNVSTDLTTPIIDKNNFVNVCQTLVRNGCFDIPSTSPDESISDTTITSTTDQTLTSETILHEYHPETTQILAEKSAINEQETWLVVDLQPMQSEKPPATSEIIVSVHFCMKEPSGNRVSDGPSVARILEKTHMKKCVPNSMNRVPVYAITKMIMTFPVIRL
jgi:hypothetical protein